jgi:hypothetical protein
MPYYDVSAAFELREDTPQDVIALLKARLEPENASRQKVLNEQHPASWVINSNWADSLHTLSSLFYDPYSRRSYLTAHFQTDASALIEPFLSWIAGYSNQAGIVGYLYDVEVGTTMLIQFDTGRAYWISVEMKERWEMRTS